MLKGFKWGRVFTFAGAIIAYLIGSGFASGQEAMQYFAAFGVAGCFGGLLLSMIIYVWFSSTIMKDGARLRLVYSNKIFEYYCGKIIGRIYEIYTPIFLFLVFVIMISGAGATLTEYYGVNPQLGRVIMALLAMSTVLMGLKRMVDIVSKLGPLIIIFGISVGLANIIMNPHGIAHANETLKHIQVMKAAPSWYVSGIIFPSMGCVMLAPFLARLGIGASSEKEAKLGGLIGAFAFVLAAGILSFGIMASIGTLYMKNVPALFIAQQMFPAVGIVFSIILFAGIYTTAVPMLWLSCNAVENNEKTKKFKILVIAATILAYAGGQFKFAELVNILYPITGYLGILLFLCIIFNQIKTKFKRKQV